MTGIYMWSVCELGWRSFSGVVLSRMGDHTVETFTRQVGWAFAIIAAPLAFSMIMNPSPEIVKDRVYGYGLAEGRLSAFATGYFVWVSTGNNDLVTLLAH